MRLSSALLFFLPLFCATSCSTCSRRNLDEMLGHTLDSIQAMKKGQDMRDSIHLAHITFLNSQIDSIVAADYNENGAATNYLLYVNKTWDKYLDLNRNGLAVVVYEEIGDIALISTLPGVRSNQHNRVEIGVGANKYNADPQNTRRLTGRDEYGHIAIDHSDGEVLHIDDSISMKVVRDIVAHPGEPVTVTAYYNDPSTGSEQVYATYTVTETDKLAIIASYKLLVMIKERNAEEGGNPEWDD